MKQAFAQFLTHTKRKNSMGPKVRQKALLHCDSGAGGSVPATAFQPRRVLCAAASAGSRLCFCLALADGWETPLCLM